MFNIFKKFNTQRINWDEIRKTDQGYPEKSLSVVMVHTESGHPATGWIDMGYTDYEYKQQCACNLQLSIEINDQTPENIDLGDIEDYFMNALKTECIAHPVARVVTDFGLIMDIYVDNENKAHEIIKNLYDSEDRPVEFGCGFNHDPKWKEYKRIIKNLT